MQIMELLWQADGPVTFREIMDISATEWGKSWKVQTLSTYLITLQKWAWLTRREAGVPMHIRLYVAKKSIFIIGPEN